MSLFLPFSERSAILRANLLARGFTKDPVCDWCQTEVPIADWSYHRTHECAHRPALHPAVLTAAPEHSTPTSSRSS